MQLQRLPRLPRPPAEPLWIPDVGQALLAWYHPARAGEGAGAGAGAGLVLCPPLGYEEVCVHRALRFVAEELAESGTAVLRIDYHGTGDSSGSDGDPDRLRAWINSIHAAAAALRARTHGPVGLLGLRLGATLALLAASERSYASVIAWAPLLSGRLYLRELRAMRLIKSEGAAPAEDAGPAGPAAAEEAAGFLLSAQTAEALGRVELLKLEKIRAQRVLLLRKDALSPEARLARFLESQQVPVETLLVDGYAALMLDPHKSLAPVAVLAAMKDWLAAAPDRNSGNSQSDSFSGSGAEAVRDAEAADIPVGDIRVRERCLRFGGTRSLFGILSSGADATGSALPTVLLLNCGAVHHIGSSRMYVTLARSWAAAGITSLRLDLCGLGESGPSDASAVGHRLYSQDAVQDVRAAMDALCARGGNQRFILLGLCSGAYVAFHTALEDPRVVGQILLNPQTFAWREGDSLEVERRSEYKSLRHYQRKLLDKKTWTRLLRGEVDVRGIVAAVGSRLWERGRERLRGALSSEPGGTDSQVARAFRTLLGRGVSTLLVYSGDDPGLDELEVHLGQRAERLARMRGFRLEIIDGPDHTFTPLWSQERLAALLTDHLLGLFGLHGRVAA